TGDDSAFYIREFAAPDGCAADDRSAWLVANPAIACDEPFLAEDGLEAARRTLREPVFRQLRLGQWPSGAAGGWIPGDVWAECAVDWDIPDGSEVCLGFDGSFSNDSTALVAVSVEADGDPLHVDVVECWERPDGTAGRDWRVPILDVENAIREACRRWQVREIACDPFRWARTYQVLEDEGLPIVEYPQSASRMTPATQRFYEAVVNGTMTHSGDPRLARHIANAVLRADSRGTRILKEHKHSTRRIDLAVAAVMAFDRASQTPATYDVLQSVW
ncbi:MAG: terminase large subunit, partial [Mycobacterium sp.]|nr:terminase large subunit [Mycobacterium sp.]